MKFLHEQHMFFFLPQMVIEMSYTILTINVNVLNLSAKILFKFQL